MDNSENQIALVKVFTTGVLTNQFYNFYLTDSRIVLISISKASSVLTDPFVMGLAGAAIAKSIQVGIKSMEKQKAKTENPILNDLLAKDKKNFAVTFSNLERLQLGQRGFSYFVSVKADSLQKEFWLDNKSFNSLASVLGTVDGLNGKYEIQKRK
ncbi:MAG: hypothetical protein ABSE15_02485 [Candidatus Bathyarchaeia archaeon]|jgi:inorganic pyrophosphatase/exopolyphosphatase